MLPKQEPIGREDALLAYKVSADIDILCMDEAMKATDKKFFIADMKK